MALTVDNILEKALKDLGADGLCNSNGACGCGVDELAPCECLNLECIAAKWISPKEGDPEYWDEYPEGYYKAIGVHG